MPTRKLTLAYDGTAYVGWQRQAAGTSIQGLLEDALSRIEGRPVAVTGAGRTDAGVHALGQVASVAFEHAIGAGELRRALNALLPSDVRVLDVEVVGPDFHARFGARRKTYRYRICNSTVASPFERLYAWHVPQRLDMAAMAQAPAALVGTHDFSAFQSTGTDSRCAVRTIAGARIETAPAVPPGDGVSVTFEVTGDGFLRHMVRSVVGTLVEVGLGRRTPDAVERVLRSRDRSAAGPTAPAHGLFLVSVDY